MNFSQINFSPNSFLSMHQFNPTKITGSVQQNIAFVPVTTAQNYQLNHVSFPSDVQVTSAVIGLQSHHHYQEAASRTVNHNGATRQVNSTSTASTAAQTPWTDSSSSLHSDNVKPNLPVFSQQSQGNQITQSVQRQPRTILMHSVSTMTDFENSKICENKSLFKGSVNNEESNESINYLKDRNKGTVCTNSCSKVHLKRSASAMDEYLGRLKQSQIPPDIEEFLKKHNIKINVDKTVEPSNLNKEYEDGSRSDSDAVLRLSTALDGSFLYCCSECQLAYSHKEQLDRHLSVHRVERKFECNVCGICLKRKEHLDQHKRGHSEERPFVCEICCKGFKRNEHLRRHIVIHSGDKNYVCTQCGKAFSRKDHLTKHLQTHVNKQAKSEANGSISPLVPAQTNSNHKNIEPTVSSKPTLN